ncbi:MAG: hypothetical protein QW052_06165 [Candidatus Nitrosocaldaceae archaeon]
MNWMKVIGNAGYTFFSILVASFSLSTFLDLEIPVWYYIILSMIVALVNAGLVFFRYLLEEAEKEEKKRKKKKDEVSNKDRAKVKLLDLILIF